MGHKGHLGVYSLHRTCVFNALRLFFLPNFPGPTFIPCPTSIPDSRVLGYHEYLNTWILGYMDIRFLWIHGYLDTLDINFFHYPDFGYPIQVSGYFWILF